MTDKEQAVIFSANLKRYLKRSGKTQKEVADALGIKPQTFNSWIMGVSVPRVNRIQMLSDYFGIEKSDLIDSAKDNFNKSVDDVIRVPVLGDVAAGIPIEANEEIIDYVELPARYANIGTFFALRIHGDSMSPRICDGDYVVVKQQSDADSGDIVIVRIAFGTATCKRLRKCADGAIELVSINPGYEPMFYTREQVESEPVEVLGVVVENRQIFKKL